LVYIIQNEPRSILCAPLINQGKLAGILYLENNLTTGAFTPDRLEVLNLLSSQAAISIENARLYANLAQSERKYRTLFEDSRDAIFISTPAGDVIDLNEATLDLFGYTRAEMMQMSASAFYVDPADRLKFKETIEDEGAVRDFEVKCYKKDRTEMDCLFTATVRRDNDGRIIAYQGIVRDITERKRAERLLADYNRTLEREVKERTQALSQALEELRAAQTQLVESEKMAALGGLVAGVAHEINTPVGIGVTAASHLEQRTQSFVDLAQSGKMKRSDLAKFIDTATQSSQMILANLSRAAELIQSFKQVAVDQLSEERRTFAVKAYLEEILLNLRPKLKRTEHTTTIRCDENLTLDGYPGVLSQVVTNLVMNSLIHAYEEGDKGRLVFDIKQEAECLIFQYSDDGKGIAPVDLGKIFDPFFTTKRGQGGSGLGLHVVYNLVTQKLNGKIRCESTVGVGTKFIVELPVQNGGK
jgi:PAS domain S-box-containing protein